ncbi:uncharacterized protein [Euwallacea similis]|uniref:uncharacterized protein isoform X2 n=1 Tax=Euwallacea similis TaxID=1736056 RepID=UPI00344EB6BE
MGNDKINLFLKDWTQFQIRRLDKIKLNSVRVQIDSKEYYAKLEITNEVIMIKPDDFKIPITTFEERHLVGFTTVQNRGIMLNQCCERPPIILFFKTPGERNKAYNSLNMRIQRTSKFYCFN